DASVLTVTVAGNAQASANSSLNSFPSSLSSGVWHNTSAVNMAFTIPYAVGSVSVTVSSNMGSGFLQQNNPYTFNVAVTPVYLPPTAPSAFSVARASDVKQDLAWTRNATASAPYTAQQALRRTHDGSWG